MSSFLTSSRNRIQRAFLIVLCFSVADLAMMVLVHSYFTTVLLLKTLNYSKEVDGKHMLIDTLFLIGMRRQQQQIEKRSTDRGDEN